MTRVDHPGIVKRGVYYKCLLALRVLGIGFLNEYLNLEFHIGNEVSSFISLYRSQVKPKRNSKYFYEILKPTLNMFQIKYPI